VTLMNATALLNASTDTTINPVTYWATTSGRLVLEHDTVNINTFWIKSMSSVATASSWRMQGGTSAAPSHNVVLGQNALSIATASGTFASAVGAGQYSNLVNSAILSPSACLNGQNVFAWGNLALAFCDGDDNIALGTGISNPALESFLPIIALTSDGTITFAAPHGWREGNFYVCSYQDSTGGSSVLQSVVAVSDAGTVGTVATIGAALVLRVVVINAWQVNPVRSLGQRRRSALHLSGQRHGHQHRGGALSLCAGKQRHHRQQRHGGQQPDHAGLGPIHRRHAD
jgi:hypothetical protein